MRTTVGLALLLSTAVPALAGGDAGPPVAPELQWVGPDTVHVDLLRTSEGGPRIYVQAALPDGERGLFLVDTGADVNVLSEEVVERLGVEVEPDVFRLSGLGGSTTAGLATLPEVRLGDAVITDLQFAVGVRGVGSTAGLMPLDGILGMETWKRFILEIDYPADLLVLHRPGTKRIPRRWTPLYFDGHRIEAAIELTTAGDDGLVDSALLQVDTGASALLLSGPSGLPFADAATEGLEPIYGVGASEFMPPSEFLRETRRIHMVKFALGGREHELDVNAQWLNYDTDRQARSLRTRGLIGHQVLADHRVFLDPQRGRIALTRSWRRKRQLDGHRVLLDQDQERFGTDAPARDLFRARMWIALDEWDRAVAALDRWVDNHPADPEGRVLLARARRFEADLPGAWQALAGLGPDGLVDEGEIIAAVNGLALEGRAQEALVLARRAAMERPGDSDAYLALADALLAVGDLDDARDALMDAAHRAQNPDAHLLRRARVAMANGDRHGALALVRRLVQLYPTEGKFLWYYSTLVTTDAEVATLRADLDAAIGRLHPDLRPLDFLVAAHHALGDEERALALFAEGLERDCAPAPEGSGKDNCTAWYLALSGQDLDRALTLVDGALGESGPRADYLDTKAVVHMARGELELAYEAALAAARLMPDDVYMLWQAERIAALRDESAVTVSD